MRDSKDIKYILLFEITHDNKGNIKDMDLAWVRDLGVQTVDFLPSELFLDNARMQFSNMTWKPQKAKNGKLVPQLGYSYYYEDHPDVPDCSNNMER